MYNIEISLSNYAKYSHFKFSSNRKIVCCYSKDHCLTYGFHPSEDANFKILHKWWIVSIKILLSNNIPVVVNITTRVGKNNDNFQCVYLICIRMNMTAKRKLISGCIIFHSTHFLWRYFIVGSLLNCSNFDCVSEHFLDTRWLSSSKEVWF